ncbi:MAG: phosphoenolpyruvate carboxylase [Alkalispirochaeta sp.]
MYESKRYRDEVSLKYELYNGLFLGLPFEDVRRTGILLPLFSDRARSRLSQGDSPRSIVEDFLSEQELGDREDQLDFLFRLIQLVERQVVLFDALEESAFARITDVEGTGTLNETLERIIQAERHTELSELAGQFRVRVVLTAHPTQFYPSRVLGIITDLSHALSTNDVPRIYDYLLQLGKTRFGNREKPTPMDEARSLLWYLEHVFYETAPAVHGRIAMVARQSVRDALHVDPIVELGFWPGGDRDGNPFVDAQTTMDVALMLRHAIVNLYLQDVRSLSRRLTFDGAIERLTSIRGRLQSTLLGECDVEDAPAYPTAHALEADLIDLWDHLHEHHDGLFAADLESLIWRLRVFGFHFATLDLRQDSRVHRRAVARLLQREFDLSSDEHWFQLEHILQEGAIPGMRDIQHRLSNDTVLADTVASLRAAREIQAASGPRALHRYIISNTQSASDILDVLYLCRCAGYAPDAIQLDILPLFETVNDLNNAESILERLYLSPVYRRHLSSRGDVQQIMLGFSDGTKDGGYVTANWLIYKTREAIARHAARHGIRVIFFEGRGGPPARGGGKTHQFYRGMDRETAGDEIHLTIQGQTITANFGTPSSARYNLEQLVTAGLETRLLSEDYRPFTERERELLNRLSDLSLNSYQQLKQDPQFLPYLEELTPLTLYGDANNASRPTSRSSSDQLRLEDLRAIPFVGAWSQMKQNVPGFFGFGSALHQLFNEGQHEALRTLFREHLFFRTLVENSMQSISKANFDVTRYLASDQRYGTLWRSLEQELHRTRSALLTITESSALLPSDSTTRQSITLREHIVLPVLTIQQYALSRLRDPHLSAEEKTACKKLVVKSMAAIINAGRNAV